MGVLIGVMFNFIGGSARFLMASIYFKLINKPNFTFEEYLHGPKHSDHFYDTVGHSFVNKMLGFIIFITLVISMRHVRF